MMAVSDKRRHPRMKMNLSVFVCHPEMGRTLMTTRDMSDEGVYVQGPLTAPPVQGAVVTVLVNGLLGSAGASVPMKVLRGDDDGLVLGFVQ